MKGKELSTGTIVGAIVAALVVCAAVGFFFLGLGGPEKHPQPGPAKIPPQPAPQAPPQWVLDKLHSGQRG